MENTKNRKWAYAPGNIRHYKNNNRTNPYEILYLVLDGTNIKRGPNGELVDFQILYTTIPCAYLNMTSRIGGDRILQGVGCNIWRAYSNATFIFMGDTIA